MTETEAIRKAYALQHEWVSTNESWFDLDRIQASIRQELKWNLEYPKRSTEANQRETRGKAILLGKIRRTLCR